MSTAPIVRFARPTDQLDAVVQFYRDGLGLQELARFADHEGFDGVMLGEPGGAWHLEFTHARGHDAGRAPGQDNLLVFYLPEEPVWRSAVERMRRCGHQPTQSFNPYWDREGVTFEDPDGYRVVLQNSAWPG